MLGILSFAGVALLPPAPPILRIDIVPMDKSAHGAVVTAAVSWFGGTIALLTFLLNREQKERHNADLARRERDLAELHRLDAEFAALVEAFSSTSSLVRANAAIGFGEIAMKPDPRLIDENGKVMLRNRSIECLDDSSVRHRVQWPTALTSYKTEESYPYFMKSVNRLSSALYQWPEADVRSEVLRVLKSLSEWAKDDPVTSTDEPLVHSLVNRLAESNRTAWSLLRERAAAALATGVERSDLMAVMDLKKMIPTRVFESGEWIEEDSPICMALFEETEDLSSTQLGIKGAGRQRDKYEAILRFRTACQYFFDSVNALSEAIRCLATPPERQSAERPWIMQIQASRLDGVLRFFKASFRLMQKLRNTETAWSIADFKDAVTWSDWIGTRRNLDLSNVRLFGASIVGASLEGANCDSAILECSQFSFARFFNSTFDRAVLYCSDFDGSHFVSSYCWETQFNKVNLSRVDFTEAWCRDAIFTDIHVFSGKFVSSNFDLSKFSGFSMQYCDMRRASVLNAQFANMFFLDVKWKDAKLAGTKFILGKPLAECCSATDFDDADFNFYEYDEDNGLKPTGKIDTALKAMLIGERGD